MKSVLPQKVPYVQLIALLLKQAEFVHFGFIVKERDPVFEYLAEVREREWEGSVPFRFGISIEKLILDVSKEGNGNAHFVLHKVLLTSVSTITKNT
mgnify:FL=1